MVLFEHAEKKIVITLQGDKEDYLNTYKALLRMMGNQNPDNKPDGLVMYDLCNLLEDMLPRADQLQ